MKLKTTKKEIKENSYYILSIGYCDAWYLLKGVNPFSYCSNIYGWACDNYEINTGKHNIIISTGYDPINTRYLKLPKDFYKIIDKYNEKAKKINSEAIGWEKVQKKLVKLLYKFIDQEVFKDIS